MKVTVCAHPIAVEPQDGWRCYQPGKPKAYIGCVRIPMRLARWFWYRSH